jgi:uncharacterized protein (UPF0261 family)
VVKVKKTVILLMTCDTKGVEAKYIKEKIQSMGVDVILVDTGIKYEPQGVVPDISHYQVAEWAGTRLEDIRNSPSRGEAVCKMADALKICVEGLYKQGKCDGILCVGGAGSFIAAPAMHQLPIGLPKLILCPLASGLRYFEPFVGSSDMVVMHSVIDIIGVNRISRMIYDNAAAALVGMVKTAGMGDEDRARGEKCIGITMMGTTTPGVMAAKEVLEKAGYTCLIFHPNGVGGRSMEKLAREGVFVGILDYTLAEMVGTWIKGFTKCSEERLTVAGRLGLPQVIVPGCVDFINLHPHEVDLPENKDRVIYNHNPQFPLARTTKEEMVKLASIIAGNLNQSRGKVHVILPLRGFSAPNHPGGPFWQPDWDNAFREKLKSQLKDEIMVSSIDVHINDKMCGIKAAEALLGLL